MKKITALYPEYLPREKWDASFAQAAAAGIEAIRFGEFAWGLLEPEEGKYRWDVFDAAFDMAEQYGLQVILCTPTACPPIWLVKNYPDVLPVNDRGETVGFGGRQHRCYNSVSMLRHTQAVVSQLARRYGKRESLLGWQIDNELAAEHKYCYCPKCVEKFHAFLKEKYQTIDALNTRWLTTFWAQNYQRFDQIPLPGRLDTFLPVRHHPSLVYEYLRFCSESVVSFCHLQADILRRYSDKPVTTNQDDFTLGDNVDWYRMFDKLDLVGFDLYSQKPHELAFYFDLCRGIKNLPFWQLEFDSRSSILGQAMDLACQRGCEAFGLFSFNPPPAGQEQGTQALVDILGKPCKNYRVVQEWQPAAPPVQQRIVQMIYDFESSWAYNASSQSPWASAYEQKTLPLVYPRYVVQVLYKALHDHGYQVEFVRTLGDGAGKTLLLPLHIVWRESFEQELLHFIRTGGHVLTNEDLFQKNGDNAYVQSLPLLYAQILGESASYLSQEELPFTARYGEGSITWISSRLTKEDLQAQLNNLLHS